MIKRRFIILSVAVVLLSVAVLFPASTAFADHDHLIIYTVATASCDSSSSNAAYWEITPREGTTTHISLWNPRVETRKEQIVPVYVNNFGFSSPPENTAKFDVLVYRVELLDSSGTVYAADQVAYDCFSGTQVTLSADYLPEDLRPALPLAQPVSNASVEPFLDQPYNGELTCGIFPVAWEGMYVISPDLFSPCAQYWPDITVACLTAEGEWSGTEVHDPILHEDGLYPLITQIGLCGVFPQPTEQDVD
jgi:hypothetical protein